MPIEVPAVRRTSKPRTKTVISLDWIAAVGVGALLLGFWVGQITGKEQAESKYQLESAAVAKSDPTPAGWLMQGPDMPSPDGHPRAGGYRPPMYPGMLYTCRAPRTVDRPELYLPKPMHVIKGFGTGQSLDLGWQTEYMMVAPGAIYKFYSDDKSKEAILFRLVPEDRDDVKWEFEPVE
jgi:hypothetical protein